MYKFKGTINGVEYTDKKAFFDALKQVKSSDEHLSVNVQEQRDNEQKKENKQAIQTTSGYQDLFNSLFGDIFLSFLQGANPAKYNKLLKQIDEHEQEQERQRSTNTLNNGAMVYQNVLKKYFFPKTSYTFKGNSEDEFHLDQFSALLAKLSREIKNEDLSNLSEKEKTDLYNKALENYKSVRENSNALDETLHTIDKEISGYENIVDSYKQMNIEVPTEISTVLAKKQHEFDVFTNTNNYYKLLIEHYRNVGPYFDPEL